MAKSKQTETSADPQTPPEFSANAMMRFAAVLVLAGVAAYYLYFNTPPEYSVQETKGITMGTSYAVKVCDIPKKMKEEDWKKITDTIQQTLDRVDQTMSAFKPDSDVSRFNASKSTDWVPVSRETAEVVQLALDVAQSTDGAFDITVGPLVEFWGFGTKHNTNYNAQTLPEQVEELKKNVGYNQLECRLEPPALKKHLPDLSIDLSAVAKGYAVDCVAQTLEKLRFKHFMVEVGGEVRCVGDKGKQGKWTIGIEKPLLAAATQFPGLQRKEAMSDLSLATSGDYQNYRDINGTRYAHILDPRTGFPTETPTQTECIGSVSVFDKTCARADALATALFVLGEEKGLEFARRNNLAVLYLLRTEGQEPVIRESASPFFNEKFPKTEK